MTTAWAGRILPGTWESNVHANCSHNEVASLRLRTLRSTPDCGDLSSLAKVLARVKKRVLTGYHETRWSYDKTAESYEGMLRRRYSVASESLRQCEEITKEDWKIKGFLKAEKFGDSKLSKPRMIFPRSPRFNLALASWLKPLEHWLWPNLTAERLMSSGVGRVVGKGLNSGGRARLIKRKLEQAGGLRVFEVDASSFEAHVSLEQLQLEHSVYLSAYKGDRHLAGLLGKQLHLCGKTSLGTSFYRKGGRASGDFNTGMGNSLIMLAIIISTLETIGVWFDTLVDGDNALVFLRPEDVSSTRSSFAAVAQKLSGHEIVLEKETSVLEEVVFGQSHPVFGPNGWTMVRDWRKVVSQATSSHHHLNNWHARARFLRGVAMAEMSLCRGMPVLDAYCRSLYSACSGAKLLKESAYADLLYRGGKLSWRLGRTSIGDETRASFARAFGTSPEEQVEYERWIEANMTTLDFPEPRKELSRWTTGAYASAPCPGDLGW
jgi:hypothetical protein